MAQKGPKGLEKTEVSENSMMMFIQIAIASFMGILNSILLIGGLTKFYPFNGNEIYGRMGYIQNIIVLLSPFLYLGFLLTLTKKIAEHYAINDEYSKQKVKSTAKFAFTTIGLLSISTYIIFSFIIIPIIYQNDIFNQSMPLFFSLFCLVWIINIILVPATGILQGFQKYRFVTNSILVSSAFSSISYIILGSINQMSLINVALVMLFSETIKTIFILLYMLYLMKHFQIIDAEMNLSKEQIYEERKELMRINGIFMFLSLFYIFIFYYDKIFIYTNLGSYAELANYILANYIFTFLFPISCSLFNALLPASSEQHILDNREKLAKYINFGTKYAIYISAIVSILMITGVAEIMPVLYGDIGLGSVQYLRFFAVILIFETLFSPLGNVMIGINVKNYALMYSIRAALNIVLWPLLFYITQNILGILVGGIISSFIWYLAGAIYLKDYLEGNKLIRVIPKAILPSIIILCCYIYLSLINFFMSADFLTTLLKITLYFLLAGVVYLVSIALMRGLSPEDLNALQRGIGFVPGSKYLILLLKKLSRYS